MFHLPLLMFFLLLEEDEGDATVDVAAEDIILEGYGMDPGLEHAPHTSYHFTYDECNTWATPLCEVRQFFPSSVFGAR